MDFVFEEAVREKAKLRMAITGPAKAGKSTTALRIASNLIPGGKIVLIDTERESSKKYAPQPGQQPNEEELTFKFYRVDLPNFKPQTYIDAIHAAEKFGADMIIIDSLTHAWKDLLAQKTALDDLPRSNSYTNWGKLTPQHEQLIETMLQSPCHIIATMRTKMAYEQVKDEDTGKSKVVKLGMEPVQRDDMPYEFDILLDMNQEHYGAVSGGRCPALEGYQELKPGAELAQIIGAWLNTGAEPPAPPMTREQFAVEAGKLLKLEDEAAIGNALKERGVVINQSARRKYDEALDALKAKLASSH